MGRMGPSNFRECPRGWEVKFRHLVDGRTLVCSFDFLLKVERNEKEKKGVLIWRIYICTRSLPIFGVVSVYPLVLKGPLGCLTPESQWSQTNLLLIYQTQNGRKHLILQKPVSLCCRGVFYSQDEDIKISSYMHVLNNQDTKGISTIQNLKTSVRIRIM